MDEGTWTHCIGGVTKPVLPSSNGSLNFLCILVFVDIIAAFALDGGVTTEDSIGIGGLLGLILLKNVNELNSMVLPWRC